MFHTPFLPDMTCLVDWALYKCHSLSLHPRPLCPQPMQSCDLCWVDVQTSGFVGLGINTFSGLCVHYFCVPCCVCWYEHSLKSNKLFESLNLESDITVLLTGRKTPSFSLSLSLSFCFSVSMPPVKNYTTIIKLTNLEGQSCSCAQHSTNTNFCYDLLCNNDKNGSYFMTDLWIVISLNLG